LRIGRQPQDVLFLRRKARTLSITVFITLNEPGIATPSRASASGALQLYAASAAAGVFAIASPGFWAVR
jgi:hypothetical protein